MTGVEWDAAEWRGLFGHPVRWLGSLRPVGGQRKIESKRRDVIRAELRTTV